MPLNTTVAAYIQELARKHSVPLSQARRMLIEQLDIARRQSVLDKRRMPGAKKIDQDNPFRLFLDTTDTPPPERVKMYDPPKKPKPVISPELSDSGNPAQPELLKTPVPGTASSIIYGELINPEKDFTQAFNSLRNMPRFDALSDTHLRQRMHDVSWRYEIQLRKEAINS